MHSVSWQGAFYVGISAITPMLNSQLFRDMILYVEIAEKVQINILGANRPF